MSIKEELQEKFELLEFNTVSDSFGGEKIDGKAPTFDFKPIMKWLESHINHLEEPLSSQLSALKNAMDNTCFTYTLISIGRFAFCIELTNLTITSTKMKTRWLPGKIIKTRPGTFENYEGEFSPGEDERSNSFENCYLIFSKCIALLYASEEHQVIMCELANQKKRSVPYESVFTYTNPYLDPVHDANNISLTNLDTINWLVKARPIIQPVIRFDLNGNRTKINEKIATKCYKTDRSQTGEVQTNRAKRWECLSQDFQHATIEQCWSVEQKLLQDLACFEGFPQTTKEKLEEENLLFQEEITLCPITFKPMSYTDLLGGGAHGESNFQVGHMTPLKSGGTHEGNNIEWISNDGNRIQGSLSVEETREMLIDIFNKMRELEIIRV